MNGVTDLAKKGPQKKQARLDLRVEQDWVDRVEAQASRWGLTIAAYIRLAVSEKLEQDEATQPHHDD